MADDPDDDDDDDDDEPDYALCPSSPDGRHRMSRDGVTAPEGYDPDAEGGVVLEIRCPLCDRLGALVARFEDVAW